MGNVCSAVILGSTRGMDSVIFATTHASNVQMRGLTNVPAVAKVNWVMTASHSKDKYKLLTFFYSVSVSTQISLEWNVTSLKSSVV